MITPKNLIKHEFIGLYVVVSDARNTAVRGIQGKVIDETKNMLVIKAGNSLKKVQKSTSEFIITLPDKKKVKILGSLIAKRPEDRIKSKLKKM